LRIIVIGTRGSALARWQANHVADRLRTLHPDLEVELRIIKTKGDKILDVPLAQVGGKGLFVKEIEEALKRGEIDLAVHSVKDVPTELVQGLGLTAIPEREDPRDAVVSRSGARLADLPRGARVGTSSLRRRCQLLALRPDLQVSDLRGNVDTRLDKLSAGAYDAVLLAAAGLRRLGHEERAAEFLAPEVMVPAVGQGALGVETRLEDREVNDLVSGLHHEPTALRVRAERAMLARLGGGCQVPVAGHARIEGEELVLCGLIGHPSGAPLYRDQTRGRVDVPEEIGANVAEQLLRRGADQILREVYSS
jgi:hydroxymethylbilane synthase